MEVIVVDGGHFAGRSLSESRIVEFGGCLAKG